MATYDLDPVWHDGKIVGWAIYRCSPTELDDLVGFHPTRQAARNEVATIRGDASTAAVN